MGVFWAFNMLSLQGLSLFSTQKSLTSAAATVSLDFPAHMLVHTCLIQIMPGRHQVPVDCAVGMPKNLCPIHQTHMPLPSCWCLHRQSTAHSTLVLLWRSPDIVACEWRRGYGYRPCGFKQRVPAHGTHSEVDRHWRLPLRPRKAALA